MTRRKLVEILNVCRRYASIYTAAFSKAADVAKVSMNNQLNPNPSAFQPGS